MNDTERAMEKFFNVAGPCNPAKHYMLPATERLPDVMRLIVILSISFIFLT